MHRKSKTEPRGSAARRIRLFGWVLAALTLCPPAYADETEAGSPGAAAVATEAATPSDPSEEQWVPELGLGFMLHVQDLQGSATANFMDVGESESDQAISPGMRLSLALKSPVLFEAAGWKPRLFVHTGVQYLLEESYTAYRGFVPGSVTYNQDAAAPNCDVPRWMTNVRGDEGGPNSYPNVYGDPNDPKDGLKGLWLHTPNRVTGIETENFAQVENRNGATNTDLNTDPPTSPTNARTSIYDTSPASQLPAYSDAGFGYGTGGFAIGGSDCNSHLRAKTSIDAMWMLGVGVEITLPVLSRQFHLRASADYIGQLFGPTVTSWDRASAFDVCTNGFVSDIPGMPSRGPCGLNPPWVDPTSGNVVAISHPKFSGPRFFASGQGDGFITHALGTGIQLDVDVYKTDNVRLSLFLEMRVAWLVTQPESTMHLEVPGQIYNDSNCQTNPGAYHCSYLGDIADPSDDQAPAVDFTILPDRFIAQGGGGVRILWTPPW